MFVKRIPITEVERVDVTSTRNHYGLAPHLNYPFGSPGLGAARELATALKVTDWVLGGDCPHFPMLLHYRVLGADPATVRA